MPCRLLPPARRYSSPALAWFVAAQTAENDGKVVPSEPVAETILPLDPESSDQAPFHFRPVRKFATFGRPAPQSLIAAQSQCVSQPSPAVGSDPDPDVPSELPELVGGLMNPELVGMPITPDDDVPEPLVVPVGLTGSDEVIVVVEDPAGALPGATAGAPCSLPVTPDRLASSPAASMMTAPAGRLTPVIASFETALLLALIVVLKVSVLVPEPPM